MRRCFVLVVLAVAACGGDEPVSAGTEEACAQFRMAQIDPPSDAAMIARMLDIADLDTSASVHSAALNLADQLEQGSQADVSEAVGRMDAACLASDL